MKITINSHQHVMSGGTPAYARFFWHTPFTNGDGQSVGAGSLQGTYARQVAVTYASGVATIAAFSGANQLDSSIDPVTGAVLSQGTLALYDAKGNYLETVYSNLRIPASPTTTTWSVIALVSQMESLRGRQISNQYPTLVQMQNYVDQSIDAILNFKWSTEYGNNLGQAVAAIGTTPVFLYLSGSVTVDSAVSVPDTMTIVPLAGARLVRSGSGTVAFGGMGILDAQASTPLFEGFSPGQITWTGSVYPKQISSELWYFADNSFCKRINCADQSNIGRPLTIIGHVGGRVITEGSVISDYHTLHFTDGELLNEINTFGTTFYRPFEMKSNTVLTSNGNTTIHESPNDGNGYMIQAWHMGFRAPTGSTELTQENMIVEKLRFLGNPDQIEISGSHSAVILGNCHASYIRFCTFERMKAYATLLGGFSALGNYAYNSGIHNNVFIGCEAQQASIINGVDCFINDNFFDCTGSNGGLVIDIEPNNPDNFMRNIVVDGNTIDCSTIVPGGTFGGIGAQAAGGINQIQGIFIKNNVIIGRPINFDTSTGGRMSVPISVYGAIAFEVSDNWCSSASGRGMLIWDCRDGVVKGNSMIACRDSSGNNSSIDLQACANVLVARNDLRETLIPYGQSSGTNELEARHTASSTGSVITKTTTAGFPRFYDFIPGLQVFWNGATYTISSVNFLTQAITLSSPVGTVVARTVLPADVNTGAETITFNSHGFNNGCIVEYSTAGTAIGGLTSGAFYYVVGATANTFQLALTLGGAAINLSSAGVGNQVFTPVVETRFSSNVYEANYTEDGHTLAATGTSQIYSTARDGMLSFPPDANYTVSRSEGIIAFNTLTASRTVTLPSATTLRGKEFIIKDASGAAATHNIVIDGAGSETIDGALTVSITSNYGRVKIKSNGSNWITI